MNQYIRIKTLLGHNGLTFSIECLRSFVQNAAQKIWLTIFEDGTLTQEDKVLLSEGLPDSDIIAKDVCEAVVLEKLRDYPACLNYRKTVIYARKIFDLMLYKEEDCLYIDSDVFFIKQFSLPDFGGNSAFMLDSINAYSFKPSEFLKINIPIFPKVNSGFFFFPFQQFDLAFIESLLQNPIVFRGYTRGISWLEQTIWSFLASKQSALQYFDSRQVIMAVEKTIITEDTICVHLVSTFRGQFEMVKSYGKPFKITTSNAEPIRLTKANGYLRPHHFYADRIFRKLKRYFV